MSGVELPEVIAKLRWDLEDAIAAGDGSRLRFELGTVELTLSVTVTNTDGGKAGLKFWVIEAGIEGSESQGATQQIKLILNPKDTFETGPDGAHRPPFVSGEAVAGEAN